jgi:hypothetical protein
MLKKTHWKIYGTNVRSSDVDFLYPCAQEVQLSGTNHVYSPLANNNQRLKPLTGTAPALRMIGSGFYYRIWIHFNGGQRILQTEHTSSL